MVTFETEDLPLTVVIERRFVDFLQLGMFLLRYASFSAYCV